MLVYDTQSRALTLGPELDRGGEAAIHPVQGQPHQVAKIYFKPAPGYDQKLTHMVAHPPADPSRGSGHTPIAWPVSLLFDGNDQFVGYLMPYVQYTTKLLTVFNPTLRAKKLPSFNRHYLHRAACNLAVAIRAIHQEGYVVGDINESNILVSDTALITIIDTDSFQVKTQKDLYLCPVGKAEYTPPELQGTSFKKVPRQPEHDHFGLGVLIFQLLMGGNHPFRGTWLQKGESPPTIEEKIAQGLFPYAGKVRKGKIDPPPNVTLDILHPRVSDLVQRCFVDGHNNPRQRPTADEWDDALGEAEKALVQCRSKHYYSNHLSDCPECKTRSAVSRSQKPLPSRPQSTPPQVPVAPAQGTPPPRPVANPVPAATAVPPTVPPPVPPPQPPLSLPEEWGCWVAIGLWIVSFFIIQSFLQLAATNFPEFREYVDSLNYPAPVWVAAYGVGGAIIASAMFFLLKWLLEWLSTQRRPRWLVFMLRAMLVLIVAVLVQEILSVAGVQVLEAFTSLMLYLLPTVIQWVEDFWVSFRGVI